MEHMKVSVSEGTRRTTTKDILNRRKVRALVQVLPLLTLVIFALYLLYTEMYESDSLVLVIHGGGTVYSDNIANTNINTNNADTYELAQVQYTNPKSNKLRAAIEQFPKVMKNTKSHSKSKCQEWDPQFASRFEATCRPWIARMNEWRMNLAKIQKQPIQYSCENEEFCHGVGDRLSGIYSVFEAGIRHERPVRVLWHGLTDVFESTCLMPETWVPQPQDTFDESCKWPASDLDDLLQDNCNPVYHICDNPNKGVQIFNFIKGCPTAETCGPQDEQLRSVKKGELANELVTINESQDGSGLRSPIKPSNKPAVALTGGTAAHVFGCPIRAMFQITPSFRNTPVQWIHNQKKTKMTVQQVETLLNGYFTISMHFRMGDGTFRGISQKVGERWDTFKPLFECAESVERYVMDKGINKGLPVKWVFASDSMAVRERVVKEFGDKIMMVGERPTHLSLSKKSSIVRAMAEWYLLSLGDRLVANRLDPMSKKLFSGRLSGFAKTFWAFQLKHLYYDAKNCRLRTMQFDGSWKPENKVCKNLSKDLFGWKLPQSHREYGDWSKLRKGDLNSKYMAEWYSDDALFDPNSLLGT